MQRYGFLARISKKTISQKIHIFKRPSKKFHKKFTSIALRVEKGGGKIFFHLLVDERNNAIKDFPQFAPR